MNYIGKFQDEDFEPDPAQLMRKNALVLEPLERKRHSNEVIEQKE